MSEEDFKSQNGYEIGGVWYPRVTRIADMKAKPALYQFYGTVGYKEGQAISKKSAEEGTLVHTYVEKLLQGDSLREVPDSIRPAIEAVQGFLERQPIHTVSEHVERRILHKQHRYAGTIDAFAKINGRHGVLDIKTSESVYRDYGIQTSAYVEALLEEGFKIDTRWILRVDQFKTCEHCGSTSRTKGGHTKIRPANGKNGNLFGNGFAAHYDLVRQCPDTRHSWLESRGIVELKEIPNWKQDFEAFLGAKKLWEWEHAEILTKIGY